MVQIFTQDKTNQHCKIQYNATLRNKNPLLCCQFAIAAYLFGRWHIQREPFPDFTSRRSWYDIKLLCAKDSFKALEYRTSNRQISAVYAATGIVSEKVTHSRGSGAREAEMEGVSEAQVCLWRRFLPSLSLTIVVPFLCLL